MLISSGLRAASSETGSERDWASLTAAETEEEGKRVEFQQRTKTVNADFQNGISWICKEAKREERG